MFGLLIRQQYGTENHARLQIHDGPGSREVVAKCHGEGLRLNDTTAFSIIASVERELRRETTQIEARHGSIKRELVGLSVQTHTAFFAHLSAGQLTQEVRRMSKHVRPRQKPPSLQRETAALRKSSRNLTSVSGGHLMAALGCFSFGSKLEEREA